MKYLAVAFFVAVILFTTSMVSAQCLIPAPTTTPTYPLGLVDEMTGHSIAPGATKCVVLIHGWNCGPDAYIANNSPEWSVLFNNLKSKLQNSDWSLLAYHWELDANTGFIGDPVVGIFQFDDTDANQAAANAELHGSHLATQLNNVAPNLREVQFIAHSAGSWAAVNTAAQLLRLNPYVVVQITLLDPYIPCPGGTGAFSDSAMGLTQYLTGNDRIQRLENYYANDTPVHGWNAFPWGGAPSSGFTWPTLDTQETFAWRNSDVNLEIDWGNTLINPVYVPILMAIPPSLFYNQYYDWHSGPILFYADTVDASISGHTAKSSLPTGSPNYDYRQFGWNRSLYAWESALPQIAIQPANQSGQIGGSATFTVNVNNAADISWYKVGGNWVGQGASLTLNNLVQGDAGSYLARAANGNGQLYSQSATLTVGTAELSISSVSPATFTGLPIGQTTLIRIIGSGFSGSSTLTFNDGVNPPYTGMVPILVSANELDYSLTAGTSQANWTVQVVNGAQTSNLGSFIVNAPSSPPTSTGSLVVNLSPPGAIAAGAQWQVDGTLYQNSGQVIGYISPGQHQVTFKPISGFWTPPSFSVSIVANQQTSTNATYTAVAATTYTLNLNYNASQGGASASPLASGNTYTAGTVVQLYASASSGFHFTGWSGDVSGTANPIPITMSANRSVTANFAAGDPSLATVTVTIQPSAAAEAGAKWGTSYNDYRDSGASYTTSAGSYFLVIHPVDGWISPVASDLLPITVTAGEVTNVIVTFTEDTTPGLLTVALSPPGAVGAGGKWHVNGGAAEGNGATVSLPPGTGYTLTFDSVPGWTAPASQSVTIQRSQTTVLTGNYIPPVGQPVIGSVSPPSGPMTGGSLLTINGVGFTAPATVLVGGQPAKGVTVSSTTQITCVTPSNSVYGTAPIIVRTGGGDTTNFNGFAYGFTLGSKLDLVSAIAGSTFGVAAQGNYVYMGEGRSLVIVDISSPASPSKVGQVTLPGLVMDIALFGNYAYVADLEGGVQIVDISNPAQPLIRGYYSTPNVAWTEGIAILGGRAYVADAFAGLQIFDLGNPVVPSLLSSTNCGTGQAVRVRASSNGILAYVSTGGTLCIIDVSAPLSPALVGQTVMGNAGGVYAISVVGNYVFGVAIWDGGVLHMVDVSNPNAPADSTPSTGDNGTGGYVAVTAANNYLYAESSVDSIGFKVFSISGASLTKSGPQINLYSDGIYNKMIIASNRAYVAAGVFGVQIVDISNANSPASLASFTDGGLAFSPNSVAISGNSLCAANGDFKVFDINNPSKPTLVGQLSAIGAGKVVAGNGKAYVTGNNNAMDVIDISTPGSPKILTTIPSSSVYPSKMALLGSTLLCCWAKCFNPTSLCHDRCLQSFVPNGSWHEGFYNRGQRGRTFSRSQRR